MKKMLSRNEVKVVVSNEIVAYMADRVAEADEARQQELDDFYAFDDYEDDYDDRDDYYPDDVGYDDEFYYDPWDEMDYRHDYYAADGYYTSLRKPVIEPVPDSMSLGDLLAKCLERA